MTQKINGLCFKNMVTYGINNLEKYCDFVNDLNVFPVPDGDTGTNMVMTLKAGLQALTDKDEPLSLVAQSFANGTVFGARGNSGVIISQFFKGVCEGFKTADDADCALFSKALETGCSYAYAAVANPVEGTVLTVMKDATGAFKEALGNTASIDEAVSVLLSTARASLERTPQLLAILAKAGVVDSGGAGFVYFLEGVQRYLNGEKIEAVESAAETARYIDYSVFGRNSTFEYGYCTETLLQLTVAEDEFDGNAFLAELKELGESLVVSFEGDKVKLHIHTPTPEKVLAFCHKFGEFLSLKIENMSVQNAQTSQKYLCVPPQEENNFAVVAVAPNGLLQKMFSEMGADVSVMSEEVPSSQDFIEAFERVTAKEILVFPNNSNSILSARQAGNLYKNANITVVDCRTVAQCYSAMSVIDFDETDIGVVVETVNEAIANIYEVDVVRAVRDSQFGDISIAKGDYFSMAGDDVLKTGDSIESIVLGTIKEVLQKSDYTVINLFYGQAVSLQQMERLEEQIQDLRLDVEVCLISTQDAIYDLILSFE